MTYIRFHVDRRGTAGLSGYVDSGFESGGWYFSRTNEDGNESGFSHPSYIPQRSYCASSLAYAGQNGDQTRRTLNELDAVAILFLSDDNGRLSSYNFSSQEFSPSDLFADGFTDVAAVLRVEFSRLGAEELEKAFQEDGPGAGAAQDGNQVTLKGASKGEHVSHRGSISSTRIRAKKHSSSLQLFPFPGIAGPFRCAVPFFWLSPPPSVSGR